MNGYNHMFMKEKPLSDKKKLTGNSYLLVLYNDEFNTFDHVIESLVEICGHDPEQAEQCALIAHHKGRCEIKTGNKKVLMAMMSALSNRNLSSEVI